MKTQDRLSAVDLRELSENQLAALRREAIRRRVSFPELLGQLSAEVADEMIRRRQSGLPA